MIAEFTVENYRSFKEKHTLSLLATKDRKLLESNTFEINNKQRLLKSAVIYGANASGKTNFFNALAFFMNFAVLSGPRKQVGDIIETDQFYFSKQTEHEPSFFELIFFIKDNEGKIIRYRYGFSVTGEEVIAEYLFAVNYVRELTLFTRDRQNINVTDNFREGFRVISAVRSNCSFLSVCAQNNGEIATRIIQFFQKVIVTSGLDSNIFASITKTRLRTADEKSINQIIDFLHFADIQVRELVANHEPININELPPEIFNYYKKNPGAKPPEKVTFHFGHDYFDNEKCVETVSIPEDQESKGTQKLFAYAVPIISALENGTALFIDEFDTQLHPIILESIIKLFNSPEKNKKNAQLVISCHAVNILTKENFRRDQVWFCEKDQYGATDLYSLVEYNEPVRNDAVFGKNYLYGKYGAIPYINEIALQIEDNNGA